MSLYFLSSPLGLGDLGDNSWPFGGLTTAGQRGQLSGGGQQGQGSRVVVPDMDWIEQDDKCIVTFDLPGLKKKEVDISLHDNILTISGNFAPGHGISEKVLHLANERRFGAFSRSITIPHGLNETEIKATMVCGILRLEFPKKAKEGPVKKITVEGGEVSG